MRKDVKDSENVITAFLIHDKVADIAKATGLSQKTIQRYRADPDFQETLRKRKADIARSVVNRMQSHLLECTDTLIGIIRNEETSPQTRVNAIQVMFNQCSNLSQIVDITERIDAIERDRADYG